MSEDQTTLENSNNKNSNTAANTAKILALAVATAVGSANAQSPTVPETPLPRGGDIALVTDNARQQAGQLQEEVANVNTLQQYERIVEMVGAEAFQRIMSAESAEDARQKLLHELNERLKILYDDFLPRSAEGGGSGNVDNVIMVIKGIAENSADEEAAYKAIDRLYKVGEDGAKYLVEILKLPEMANYLREYLANQDIASSIELNLEHGAVDPKRIEIAKSKVLEYQKRADHFRDLLVEGVNVDYTRRLGSRTFERTLDNSTKQIILSSLSKDVVDANTNDQGALDESIRRSSSSK